MAAISNTSASTSASASASIRQRQTSALSPGKKPDEQEIRQMASEINRTGDRPLWFDDRDERMQAFARQAAQLPTDARPQLLKEIIDQRPDAIHDWVGAQRLEQLAGAGRISAEEKAAVQSTVAAAYTEGHITHAQMQTIMGVASMPPGHNPARFETARSFLTGNAPEMAGARAKFLRDSFAAHAERAANGYGGRPDFNSALALTLMQSGGQQSDVARIFSKLTPAEQSLAAAGVGAAAVGYRYSQPHVNGLTDPWAVLHRAVVQANPPATRQGQLQLTRMAEGLASSGRYATPESDKAVTDLYAQVAEGRARQKMDDPQAMAEGLARVANAESRAAGVLKTLPPDASAEQIWQAIQKNPGAFTDPVFVQYLELRGDQARHLQGSDLRNDIGLALGLPVTQAPANEVQQARMERGELDFFNVNAADEAGQAIRSIEAQIQKAGGESARVAALPVTVASKEHGLIQTVIWRVETADGQEKFVDYNPATQEARTYASFEDWKNNNQLPPGEMTYARNGHLTAGVDGKPQLETGNTPNTVDTAWEAWIKPALDGAALAGGIVLLGAAVVGTDGTAGMVGGALLGAYGAGTGGVELADRAAHGQTLSLGNAQARNAWLNVGASALSLGAMGASMRLANMSGRATGNAIDEAVQLTRMAQTARGLNVAAQYADTAAFADGGLMLAANWDRMTPAERTQALAMMAFWSAGTAVSARQAGGVKNLYGVKDFSNAISSTHRRLKSQIPADAKVVHNSDVSTHIAPNLYQEMKAVNTPDGKAYEMSAGHHKRAALTEKKAYEQIQANEYELTAGKLPRTTGSAAGSADNATKTEAIGNAEADDGAKAAGLVDDVAKVRAADEVARNNGYTRYHGTAHLYRGDSRTPEEIFDKGFDSRGIDTDLAYYQLHSNNSIYISTSTSREAAEIFAQPGGYVYEIDPRRLHGIDVNSSLGESSVFPDEEEIAIVRQIPSENIIGAREVLPNRSLGDIIRNPNYQE